MIEYVLVLFFAVFIRLFPLRNLHSIDFDTYGHLTFANEVFNQKASPWGPIKLQCWKSDNYRLPYLWHWFVGRLPKSWLTKYSKWLNGIIDALFATFIYWLLLNYFQDASIAFIGLLLYLFTPMWFSSIAIGTRIASFTPRLISEILVNTSLVILLFDIGLPYEFKILLASFLTMGVLLSSKFGFQAVIFIFPLTYLFSGSYFSFEPLIVILISIIILMIISKGEATRMFKRQLDHLTEYYRNNLTKPNDIFSRNKLSNIFVWSRESGLNFYNSVWNILATNSYTSVIFKMPIFLCVFSMITYGALSGIIQLNQPLYSTIIASTFLFFLINRPNLLFLGEAERYINHISIFLIFALIQMSYTFQLEWIPKLLVFYGVIYWTFESFILNRLSAKKERRIADKVIENYLKSSSKKRLINSFPYHKFSLFRVMFMTKHDVLFPLYMEESYRKQFKKDFELKDNYLDISKLDEIHKISLLDTIILDKKALQAEGLENWKPSKKWKKLNLNQSLYDIYEIL